MLQWAAFLCNTRIILEIVLQPSLIPQKRSKSKIRRRHKGHKIASSQMEIVHSFLTLFGVLLASLTAMLSSSLSYQHGWSRPVFWNSKESWCWVCVQRSSGQVGRTVWELWADRTRQILIAIWWFADALNDVPFVCFPVHPATTWGRFWRRCGTATTTMWFIVT